MLGNRNKRPPTRKRNSREEIRRASTAQTGAIIDDDVSTPRATLRQASRKQSLDTSWPVRRHSTSTATVVAAAVRLERAASRTERWRFLPGCQSGAGVPAGDQSDSFDPPIFWLIHNGDDGDTSPRTESQLIRTANRQIHKRAGIMRLLSWPVGQVLRPLTPGHSPP